MLAFNLKSLQCLRTGAFFEYTKPLHTKSISCLLMYIKKGVCAIFESIHCKDDVHLLAKAMRCGSRHNAYCGSNMKLLPF